MTYSWPGKKYKRVGPRGIHQDAALPKKTNEQKSSLEERSTAKSFEQKEKVRGKNERGIGAERENKNSGGCVRGWGLACVLSMHILGWVQGLFDGAAGVGVPALERFACLATCASNER